MIYAIKSVLACRRQVTQLQLSEIKAEPHTKEHALGRRMSLIPRRCASSPGTCQI